MVPGIIIGECGIRPQGHGAMRIAMLSIHSSPLASLGGKEAGGMNVYVRELARELGRRGLKIDIFTRSQRSAEMKIIDLDRGVRVVNLQAGPAAPYDKNWLLSYLPEFVNRVRCFADGDDLHYDLIHSHYWLSGEAALMLRRAWRVPVVHMFHTLGALKNKIARGAEERETAQRVMIERRLMGDVDALIAATPLDKAQMVWEYGADADHIHVVPAGVDLRRFHPRDMADARHALDLPPPPHRLIMLAGRIEPLKGIDALIEATALLLQKHPEWQNGLSAVIVGGAAEHEPEKWNTEQRRLDALRRSLGIAGHIRFVGSQPQDQLARYFNAADIVSMPSHYESFGMAALEGLASGRPVVATSAGGPAYIVEQDVSGLLVQPDNAQLLAEQLERLLVNDTLREEMGLAARTRALRFGWSSVACDVLKVYRTLVYAPRLAEVC